MNIDAADTSRMPASDVDRLIQDHLDRALSMASRYRNRGIELEDLQQVAQLGLVKAAQRFDPDAGHDFLSFAVPTIRGELRRHFRDAGWAVRPPRRIQQLQAHIGVAVEELAASLGRSPRPSEIAAHLGTDIAEVIEALSADGCFRPTSLDMLLSDSTDAALGDLLGTEDREVARTEAHILLEPLLRELSVRDRRILRLRFYDDWTQDQIAHEVGVTQAQVSRILYQILSRLRDEIERPGAAA